MCPDRTKGSKLVDHSVSSPTSSRTVWTVEDVETKIGSAKVVVFAKGNSEEPLCGFSEKVIDELSSIGKPFEIVNVEEERSVIAALNAFAGCKNCLPLLYVDGSLVCSSDNQSALLASGELRAQIEKAFC